MEKYLEERFANKFCYRLNNSATKTFNLLQDVYSDEVLSHASTFRGTKSFIEGREDVEYEHQAG